MTDTSSGSPHATWRVLVVEDDAKTADLIALYLRHAGHIVRVERDGVRAQQRLRAERFDVAVLDVMLPGVDGLALCQELVGAGPTAVILLTARTQEHQRIEGLRLGADDYVSKPFSPRELVARVEAVMRRRGVAPSVATAPLAPPVHVGALVVDASRGVAVVRGEAKRLTRSECAILQALATHAGQVLDRAQLLAHIKGDAEPPTERTVDVHIRNLRRKIERTPATPEWIETVIGFGYRLRRAE